VTIRGEVCGDCVADYLAACCRLPGVASDLRAQGVELIRQRVRHGQGDASVGQMVGWSGHAALYVRLTWFALCVWRMSAMCRIYLR
jgi:hypothetical protein